MSNEAEPMPSKWTSDMTGQIYPVGVIPESQVYSKKTMPHRSQAFLKILKERISCAVTAVINIKNKGFTFL
jgi:hypothetical protein